MDRFRIDSHKLQYHVRRVSEWLEGENIYPIYMEISPSGACNHRCTFCGLDFMEYKARYLDADLLSERLAEMGALGLKSVMYAGEGEPFLHRRMTDILTATRKAGIDAAFTTNAVLLDEAKAEQVLPMTEWIKVSINAGTPGTYARIHRTRGEDFDRVIRNMTHAARLRRDAGVRCALGMQMILLPENAAEATLLARIARDIGMDYLVIKPYSQHLQSRTDAYQDVRYESYGELADALSAYNSENFSVVFRTRAMKKWDAHARGYRRCLALPFWSYLDAGGHVWGCSVYLGDERFYYGSIYEESFRSIWEGDRRRKSLEWVHTELNAEGCRVNCRMDEINRYLWELRDPPEHVNFI